MGRTAFACLWRRRRGNSSRWWPPSTAPWSASTWPRPRSAVPVERGPRASDPADPGPDRPGAGRGRSPASVAGGDIQSLSSTVTMLLQIARLSSDSPEMRLFDLVAAVRATTAEHVPAALAAGVDVAFSGKATRSSLPVRRPPPASPPVTSEQRRPARPLRKVRPGRGPFPRDRSRDRPRRRGPGTEPRRSCSSRSREGRRATARGSGSPLSRRSWPCTGKCRNGRDPGPAALDGFPHVPGAAA